jgi:hypothetical protein
MIWVDLWSYSPLSHPDDERVNSGAAGTTLTAGPERADARAAVRKEPARPGINLADVGWHQLDLAPFR